MAATTKATRRGDPMTRRKIATMILTKMLDSPGPEDGKVEAAVRYTDKLLKALDRAKTRRQEDNGRST